MLPQYMTLSFAPVWFIAGHTVDLALYYTFDEDNVYLLSVQRVTLLLTFEGNP
jgi:hypothetical protein